MSSVQNDRIVVADYEPEAVFQALADRTRLRCIALIATHGELCVCELVHAIDVSQPKISRHLRLLRDARLVADRRDGTWIHYRLADTLPSWLRDTVDGLFRASTPPGPFIDDARRLSAMPDRPGGRCPAASTSTRVRA